MEYSKKKRSLWFVLFIVFLDWMGIGLVYPMFCSMLFQPNCLLLNETCSMASRGCYLGALLAAMPIAQFFSGPILGVLSDQNGRRLLLLWTLVLAGVGYIFCAIGVWVESIFLLIGARVVIGIAAGNTAIVSATVADVSDSSSKARNFGLYSMASGVGFAIGPCIGGLFSEIAFSLPFLLSAIIMFVAFFLILFFFSETHSPARGAAIHWNKGLKNIKKAFQVPNLRILFLTILIFCFGWSFFYEFIPVTWISAYRLNPSQIGLFYAYGAGWYAISSGFLIRPVVNRYKHHSVLFYALVSLGCLILLLLFYQPTVLWVWVYLPVVNFLVALLYPTSTAMVSDWANKDSQGEILGILQSIQAIAFAMSPLIAGTLLGINPLMPMIFGGVSMLLAALILALFLRKEVFS